MRKIDGEFIRRARLFDYGFTGRSTLPFRRAISAADEVIE
jgi:hypothetical protein